MRRKVCCVHSCLVPGERFTRFPIKNRELYKLWLQKINNPQLFSLPAETVYDRYRVCDRHFEEKWLQVHFYVGSNRPVVRPGAYPTLFLNEEVNRARQDVVPVHLDHVYTATDNNMAVDVQKTSSTSYNMCVSVNRDNNLDVHTEGVPSTSHDVCMLPKRDNSQVTVATTSSASGPPRKPSERRGLLRRMKARRMVRLTSRAKFLYQQIKTMERKYVCKSKGVKRLSACFKEAALSKSLQTVEQITGLLEPTTRRFLLQQRKNKHGRRFTIDEKIMALSLLKRMRGAYKLMGQYFTMPSVASLRRVLARTPFRPGVNVDLNNHLKSVHAMLGRKDDYCILLFDQIAIQPHLSFNEGEDVIWGFQNCGTSQRSVFAERALVFMLRGFYCRWKQPYAFMFVGSSTTAADLVCYIKEVLRSALSTNLKVVATICDQNATNITAINALKQETRAYCERAGLVFRPESFIFEGREIVHLYEPAQLLKGMRNNLLTKDLDFTLDNTQYRATWQDIIDFYNYDCRGTVVRCPSLNDFNVLPHKIHKMSTKNCDQVFSRTVYAGMQNLLDERPPELHGLRQTAFGTAKLIGFMDKLFDSVSGTRNPDKQTHELRCPLSQGSKHIEFWNEAIQILRTMKFVKRSGSSDHGGCVPSLTNWMVTLNGFLYLWKSLKHVGFKSLDMRAFSQDSLENFLSSIRSHLGANRNPTCASFVSSFRTLCVDNRISMDSVALNYKEEDDVALTNLRSFLSEDVSGLSTCSSTSDETVILDHTYKRQWDTAPTAYVSRYVARKLVKLDGVSTCPTCTSKLLTTETLPEHSFIADMELTENRLTRPNTCFMKLCTTVMDTTLRLLPLHGHKNGIMKLIKGYVYQHQLVPSLACGIHDVTNAFVDFTVKFTIYFWTKNINQLLTGRDTRIRPNMDRVERLAVERYRKSLKRRI